MIGSFEHLPLFKSSVNATYKHIFYRQPREKLSLKLHENRELIAFVVLYLVMTSNLMSMN